MAGELVVFEQELQPLASRFEDVLAGFMPVERLMRTAMIAVEKNPYLLECNRQSLFNSIMTSAVLALEMDGVTGQAFPIPFAKKVQLVIGYKGYNTLGARAGLTITGDVVKEGDAFDYEKGTNPFLKFKEGPKRGQITHAWAVAAANDRPPIIEVLSIDDLMAVKNKSPGGKKADSPWNDPSIGFAAMCSKTAKRRLCRSTPLNIRAPQMQLAARMEEAYEEQGKHAFILPDRGLIVEGEESPVAPRMGSDTPEAETLDARTEPKADAPRDPLSRLKADGMKAAGKSTAELKRWWDELHPLDQKRLAQFKDETLKPIAAQADAA